MIFKGFNMTYDEVMEIVNNIIPIFENSSSIGIKFYL